MLGKKLCLAVMFGLTWSECSLESVARRLQDESSKEIRERSQESHLEEKSGYSANQKDWDEKEENSMRSRASKNEKEEE